MKNRTIKKLFKYSCLPTFLIASIYGINSYTKNRMEIKKQLEENVQKNSTTNLSRSNENKIVDLNFQFITRHIRNHGSIRNINSNKKYVFADSGNAGQGVTASGSMDFEITTNLLSNEKTNNGTYPSPINNYYIGDWQSVLKHLTIMPWPHEKRHIFSWYGDHIKDSQKTYFSPFNVERGENIGTLGSAFKQSTTFNLERRSGDINSYIKSHVYERYAFYEHEYEELIANNSNYIINNNDLKIRLNIWLSAKEVGAFFGSWETAKSYLEWKDKVNINLKTHLSYSDYDLTNWKEYFKRVLAAPIRLVGVKNPIIFDKYNHQTDNENKVKQIIQKRINNFFTSDPVLLNKLGPLVKINPDGTYTHDPIEIIEIQIPEYSRGKSGKTTANIVLKLANNRQFTFENNIASNTFSVPIDIFAILDPNSDVEIDKLITIEPYQSPIPIYDKKLITINQTKEILISDNRPKQKKLKNFRVNLNHSSISGDNRLIPNEKIPIIGKVGTDITVELLFDIGDIRIIKTISFKGIFNNGTTYQKIYFTPDEINNANTTLPTTMEFGLTIEKDKIILFNKEELTFDFNETNLSFEGNVSLSTRTLSALIPLEQKIAPSQWIRTEQSKYIKDFKYFGKFQTFNPFIFTFNNLLKELPGSLPGTKPVYVTKYKPFLREGSWDSSSADAPSDNPDDLALFPKATEVSDQSQFKTNLGNFIMENKEPNSLFKFQIIIKEYQSNTNAQPDANKYTKIRALINVSVDMSSQEAFFNMSGYKDNKIIEKKIRIAILIRIIQILEVIM